jgi:isopentenyl diphosphate isomerase/L-lactate dehydrogenase-like FMN-dependent dehydrogenase
VQGDTPIIMDSGVDVAKALALGATAIAISRPVWWALTLGVGGVAGLVDYFNRELVNTILHLGSDEVAALGREHVRPHRG